MNTRRAIAAAFSCLVHLPVVLAQGLLTPPGAPAPTMKTLQQVEPRTDLQATPAPPGVDASNAGYHYIITQPGSYYLSANLGVTRTNGIQINAEGVTLDLNGFQISRTSGTGGTGIEIPLTSHRAAIRTGSIKGFASGVECVAGGGMARACFFRDLAVSGCTFAGIIAGEGAVLEDCRMHDNTAAYGIFAARGSILSRCTASNNTGPVYAYGIYAPSESTLSHCTAVGNGGRSGIYVGDGCMLSSCIAASNAGDGIQVISGCTISHCIVYENGGSGIDAYLDSSILNCTATANGAHGIVAGQRVKINGCNANLNGTGTSGSGIVTDIRAMVTDCSASNNQKSGIVVLGESFVRDCRASLNGRGGVAAGIDSTGGGGSRIEGNQARDNNGTGILAGGADIVIRNSAGANTTNFNPSSGANFAPVQSPSTATNPLANIQF